MFMFCELFSSWCVMTCWHSGVGPAQCGPCFISVKSTVAAQRTQGFGYPQVAKNDTDPPPIPLWWLTHKLYISRRVFQNLKPN